MTTASVVIIAAAVDSTFRNSTQFDVLFPEAKDLLTFLDYGSIFTVLVYIIQIKLKGGH